MLCLWGCSAVLNIFDKWGKMLEIYSIFVFLCMEHILWINKTVAPPNLVQCKQHNCSAALCWQAGVGKRFFFVVYFLFNLVCHLDFFYSTNCLWHWGRGIIIPQLWQLLNTAFYYSICGTLDFFDILNSFQTINTRVLLSLFAPFNWSHFEKKKYSFQVGDTLPPDTTQHWCVADLLLHQLVY